MEHSIVFNSHNAELSAVLHYPTSKKALAGQCRWPLVIICHGFAGNKIGENRLFVKAARALSEKGYMVLRFDYGGCGESTGDYGAGGLDVLVEQTRSAIDYGFQLDCVDPSRIILLGHSLGGAAALLTAAKDNRVRTLVLWAAVAHPLNDIVGIIGQDTFEHIQRDGAAPYRGYMFTSRFLDSLAEHQPLQQVTKFSGDVFLLHGTADQEIPVDYCYMYQRLFWTRADGMCDKEVLFHADHTFTIGDTAGLAIEKTGDWLVEIDKRKTEWNHWSI